MSTTSTTAPTRRFPDAAGVLAACREILTDTYPTEQTLITDTAPAAATPAGVRVHFTTYAARDTAHIRLHRLGYAVTWDSRAEGGKTILVTGWDDRHLAARADRAELAVDRVRSEHDHVAADAIADYRTYRDFLHHTAGKTRAQVIFEQRRRPRRYLAHIARARSVAHPTAPVDAADLQAAPANIRALLARVAAAETTLDRLSDAFGETVAAVIDLYEENRVRRRLADDEAAAAAVLGVADATAALLEHALADMAGPPHSART